jgi:hypothetical protein
MFDWQTLVALTIVAMAAGYMLRLSAGWLRSGSAGGCDGCSQGGCQSAGGRKSTSPRPLFQLQVPQSTTKPTKDTSDR